MGFLSVTSGVGIGVRIGTGGRLRDERHDDILGCHEVLLLGDSFGVNDESFASILKSAQGDVGCEERFGEGDPTVCAGRK